MTEITTTETTAAAATVAPVTDIATKRPSSRERARAASAEKQAGGALPAKEAGGALPAQVAGKALPAKADALGEEPHTAALRTRFEALSQTKRKAVIRAARAALAAGGTRAAAWNTAMAEVAPPAAKPKAEAKAPAQPRIPAKFKGVAVTGYTVQWPHGGYDLLRTTDKAAERPAWLVRCNVHGTTKPIKAAKEGDQLGTNAGRPAWCAPCKADAAKAAKA
jgi:hypothetical protein